MWISESQPPASVDPKWHEIVNVYPWLVTGFSNGIKDTVVGPDSQSFKLSKQRMQSFTLTKMDSAIVFPFMLDNPYSIYFSYIRTLPMLEWYTYVVWWDMCLKEINVHTPNKITV